MILHLHIGTILSKIIYLKAQTSSTPGTQDQNAINKEVFYRIWQYTVDQILLEYTKTDEFVSKFNDIISHVYHHEPKAEDILLHIIKQMRLVLDPASIPIPVNENDISNYFQLINLVIEKVEYKRNLYLINANDIQHWHRNTYHKIDVYIFFYICEHLLKESLRSYGHPDKYTDQPNFDLSEFLIRKFSHHIDQKSVFLLRGYKTHDKAIEVVDILDLINYNRQNKLLDYIQESSNSNNLVICSFNFMDALMSFSKEFGDKKSCDNTINVSARSLVNTLSNLESRLHESNAKMLHANIKSRLDIAPVILNNAYLYESYILLFSEIQKEQLENFLIFSGKINKRIIELLSITVNGKK